MNVREVFCDECGAVLIRTDDYNPGIEEVEK